MKNRSIYAVRTIAIVGILTLLVFFGLQSFTMNPPTPAMLLPLIADGKVMKADGVTPFIQATGYYVHVTGGSESPSCYIASNANWGFSDTTNNWPTGNYVATTDIISYRGKTYQGSVTFYHVEGEPTQPVNIPCYEIAQ